MMFDLYAFFYFCLLILNFCVNDMVSFARGGRKPLPLIIGEGELGQMLGW